uniref:Lipase maturation factor n=1 Tax=Corethron hystrix TaxID=216773 RepID=A0A7S1FVU6_9STRA|mmetsp:Transcript_32003/g.73628  ORF Transcript_32003/g.73628 Transcript_32003/m.73628 type:complete len:708 (+) Transcript_32003:400-2523(+)|eukprot:CAMPEP_0113302220 /NCGR_PEP_ID=MMETSP0010_2-20120614/3122_1 /TAXON_ID=216773 ORGANISM="Corethron hystrix, Strain 308" /NCGR_SAMPLE_ID=MMETSP0010_2 /ASSEMBLY_ACC=CAM_ASM_000155 /LENGTH=707 /DNA_ID=CAMNT_0000155971 /DNA_START=352 /DNA_END=2475 /DNA_ORIENTATION=- /assembly_acc=CAM_ASM_000155
MTVDGLRHRYHQLRKAEASTDNKEQTNSCSIPPPEPTTDGKNTLYNDYSDSNDKERRQTTHKEKITTLSPSPAKYRETFYISRYLMLRLMGAMYLFSFLTAYHQLPALIGPEDSVHPGGGGLMPATQYVQQIRKKVQRRRLGYIELIDLAHFYKYPTVFSWFPVAADGETDGDFSKETIRLASITGICLSFLILCGMDSFMILLMLWVLDHSIVTVAESVSTFYAYGWESQILETGFLCLFLCDLPHLFYFRSGLKFKWVGFRGMFTSVRFDDEPGPSRLPALWMLRWLIFRISIGAGLIKFRGSSCWQDRTCLHYHFETQPLPSPLSFIFHFLPKDVLSAAVRLDLIVQLYLSWMVLVPGWGKIGRLMRRFGGYLQALFMVNIMASGNYSFLNHLTILPALACIDDGAYPYFVQRMVMPQLPKAKTSNSRFTFFPSRPFRRMVDLAVLLMIFHLSQPVVMNLLQIGGRQAMNASFNSLKLVNTYGAFGSVGEKRYEPIVSISHDGHKWHEIEFPCKPGDVRRRPCFCAPYHYRLDWNIWFIGFKPHEAMLQQREQWVYQLLLQMLKTGDEYLMRSAKEKERERRHDFIEDQNGNNLDLTANKTLLSPPLFLNLLDSSAAIHFPPVRKIGPKYAKVDMYHYKMAASLWDILRRKANRWPYWVSKVKKGEAYKEIPEDIQWWKRKFEQVLIPPVMLHTKTKDRFMRMP